MALFLLEGCGKKAPLKAPPGGITLDPAQYPLEEDVA